MAVVVSSGAYVEEAADLVPMLLLATEPPASTLLELGSGGGSLAFHLKNRLQLTLTDRSPQMLAVDRAVNPECEHILGDMYSLRLCRQFDIVLIHDAIMYAEDAASLRTALETAAQRCRPGGAVVLVPDFVKETFKAETTTGGEDGTDGRGLRYLGMGLGSRSDRRHLQRRLLLPFPGSRRHGPLRD